MEATLKRLLEEIEATKRRVNALEFKVIPELEEAKLRAAAAKSERESKRTYIWIQNHYYLLVQVHFYY